jgi:ribonuclease HI
MIQLFTKSTNNNFNKIHPSNDKTEYVLYFDGASKGNPGISGIGMVIYKNGNELWCESVLLQDCFTNNQAEYYALIYGLDKAIHLKINEIQVYGDSKLVINQMNGIYKVKNEALTFLHKKAVELSKLFDNIQFTHIYREHNKRADELANLSIKKEIKQTKDNSDKYKINKKILPN